MIKVQTYRHAGRVAPFRLDQTAFYRLTLAAPSPPDRNDGSPLLPSPVAQQRNGAGENRDKAGTVIRD